MPRVVEGWGGTEGLLSPDAEPVLSGGFALVSGDEVVLEPMCCGDLQDLSDWRQAAEYRGADWQMVWIGHPWVSVRFSEGVLVLSRLHESDAPVGQYTLRSEDLDKAVAGAAAELEDFSRRLRAAVEPIVGAELAPRLGRQLAGLTADDGTGAIGP